MLRAYACSIAKEVGISLSAQPISDLGCCVPRDDIEVWLAKYCGVMIQGLSFDATTKPIPNVVYFFAPVFTFNDFCSRVTCDGSLFGTKKFHGGDCMKVLIERCTAVWVRGPDELRRYVEFRFGNACKLSQRVVGEPFGWSQVTASRQKHIALDMCREVLLGGGYS